MRWKVPAVLTCAVAMAVGSGVGAGASEPPANSNATFVSGTFSTVEPPGLRVTISAQLGPDGKVSGQATAHQGNDEATARVTCLNVVGNTAKVELRMVRSSDPSKFGSPGQFSGLELMDNGQPQMGQTVDQVAGDAPQDQPIGCDRNDYFPFVMESGNVVVSDGA